MNNGRFHRLVRAASVVTIAVGTMGLLGWVFDVALLKSLVPGLATMKVNTAVAFVLAGASLGLQLEPAAPPHRRSLGRACALLVMAVGVGTLTEHVVGVDLGIDLLLLQVPAEPNTPHPGRMAPNTALCLVLAGAALVGLDARSRALRSSSQVLALAVLLVSFLGSTGYLFKATALQGIAGYAMALHTAIGFVVVGCGILLARPQRGGIVALAQDNPAGATARRLLPLTVATLLGVAWIRLQGQHAGLYGTEFGLALMVTVSASLLVSLVLWSARVQGRSDDARQQVTRDDRFLFELGDLLRTSATSSEILSRVSKKLGGYLQISRCMFIEIDAANDRTTVRHDYHDGVRSLAGTRPLSSYAPDSIADARAGRTVVNHDASTDPRTADRYEAAYRAADLRGYVAVPFLRSGQWESTLLASTREPRAWQAREIALMQSVAEQTWLWFDQLRIEERFHLFVDAVKDYAIFLLDPDGLVATWNAGAERLNGYRADEVVGQHIARFYTPGDVAAGKPQHELELAARDGAHEDEGWRIRKDGSRLWANVVISALRDADGELVGFGNVIRDMTERKRAEHEREALVAQLGALNAELEERVRARTAQLTATLKEREVLLQEVHHRVKNNLQVVSSLINMQLRKLEGGPNRSGLEECRSRVEAIALIHEQLYQSRDYARVPFSEYARSLAGNIFHATGVSPASITLGVDIEAIALPVDKAIPCGLILNELITNALKHAFPDERPGAVQVALRRTPAGEIVLTVSDNGVGMAHDLDPSTSSSLGLQLVTTLVEQLDGRLDVVRQDGMVFRITLPAEGIA